MQQRTPAKSARFGTSNLAPMMFSLCVALVGCAGPAGLSEGIARPVSRPTRVTPPQAQATNPPAQATNPPAPAAPSARHSVAPWLGFSESSAPDPQNAPTPRTPPHPDPARVAALAAALRGAQTAAEVFALADPEHGLEVDYNARLGHLHHPVCTARGVTGFRLDLNDWLDGEEGAEAPLYSRDPDRPFSCSTDLSVCVDCSPDLSDCEDATLFRFFPDAAGVLRLRGIAGYFSNELGHFEPEQVVNLDAVAEIGFWGQYGGHNALCPMELFLARTPPSQIRYELLRTPLGPVESNLLTGLEARQAIADVGARLGSADSCCRGQTCVLPPNSPSERGGPPGHEYRIHFRYDGENLRILALSSRPAECENAIMIESPSAGATECDGGLDGVQVDRETGQRVCWTECARFPIEEELESR